MRILLIIFACFQMYATTLIAQCFQGTGNQKMEVYSSTGNSELDDYLNMEKKVLEEKFSIKVELKVLNDSKAPNAYATEESSNPFYFDGTVYLGKYLLDKEIRKNENGLDAVRGIMAHEFAHILQTKMSCELDGSVRELHADFLAGYYMGKSGLYTKEGLMAFGQSLYEKGDNFLWNKDHHGTPKQRYLAMMGGFEYSKEEKANPERAYFFGINLLTNGNENGDIGIKEASDYKSTESVAITYNKVRYDKVYIIKFTTNNIEYNGLLLMKEGNGVMRLRHPMKGQEDKIVEETMTTKAGKKDNYIEGSNPINPVTRIKLTADEYSPDSFYFYTNDYDKSTEMWMIDTKGNSAKVTSLLVTDSTLADEWLAYLKW